MVVLCAVCLRCWCNGRLFESLPHCNATGLAAYRRMRFVFCGDKLHYPHMPLKLWSFSLFMHKICSVETIATTAVTTHGCSLRNISQCSD